MFNEVLINYFCWELTMNFLWVIGSFWQLFLFDKFKCTYACIFDATWAFDHYFISWLIQIVANSELLQLLFFVASQHKITGVQFYEFRKICFWSKWKLSHIFEKSYGIILINHLLEIFLKNFCIIKPIFIESLFG